ncbi:MAG: hypothetical protein SGPRY_010694, partial [Prymnesium sp.]
DLLISHELSDDDFDQFDDMEDDHVEPTGRGSGQDLPKQGESRAHESRGNAEREPLSGGRVEHARRRDEREYNERGGRRQSRERERRSRSRSRERKRTWERPRQDRRGPRREERIEPSSRSTTFSRRK